MQAHFVPVRKGMDHDELKQRILTGWSYFGRQSVQCAAIVNVGNPSGPVGVEDVDIWVIPEPMIPQSILAQILVGVHQKQKDPALALDDVARAVFGQGILPLVEAFTSAAETEQGGSEDVE
jgi:hypothetical protein